MEEYEIMGAEANNNPEIIEVEKLKIACDGDGGAMGHPRVFLTIDPAKSNYVECQYCDRRFVLKEGAKISGHH